jgi:hypothetical protein
MDANEPIVQACTTQSPRKILQGLGSEAQSCRADSEEEEEDAMSTFPLASRGRGRGDSTTSSSSGQRSTVCILSFIVLSFIYRSREARARVLNFPAHLNVDYLTEFRSGASPRNPLNRTGGSSKASKLDAHKVKR